MFEIWSFEEYFEVLGDMMTSDFWTLGGQSAFFSNPLEAKIFAEEKVFGPYPEITDAQKDFLYEKSELVYEEAMYAQALGAFYMTDEQIQIYGPSVTPFGISASEAAWYYWNEMIPYIDSINNEFLSKYFRGQADINQEVVEYKKGGITGGDAKLFKIPWWVFAGVGLVIFTQFRR